MRRPTKPPGATEKPWGWSIQIHADEHRRITKCYARDGGFCSTHRHHHQDNIFIVETGWLRIHWEEKNNYQTVWIKNSENYTVPALITHSFEALADTFFLEVYLGRGNYRPQEKDIERFSEGGVK